MTKPAVDPAAPGTRADLPAAPPAPARRITGAVWAALGSSVYLRARTARRVFSIRICFMCAALRPVARPPPPGTTVRTDNLCLHPGRAPPAGRRRVPWVSHIPAPGGP
ncbi:hypothetical protein ACFQ7G_34525 [Streptomyces massasporeus]